MFKNGKWVLKVDPHCHYFLFHVNQYKLIAIGRLKEFRKKSKAMKNIYLPGILYSLMPKPCSLYSSVCVLHILHIIYVTYLYIYVCLCVCVYKYIHAHGYADGQQFREFNRKRTVNQIVFRALGRPFKNINLLSEIED